jgi:VanZ family protein
MDQIFRLAAWAAIALLTVLSLVPGHVRPHVFASGHFEHFIAYFLTSSAFVLAYRGWAKAVLIAFCLSGYSGILEIIQLSIPGRHGQLSDFLISSTGACTGTALLSIALLVLQPRQSSSPSFHDRRSGN